MSLLSQLQTLPTPARKIDIQKLDARLKEHYEKLEENIKAYNLFIKTQNQLNEKTLLELATFFLNIYQTRDHLIKLLSQENVPDPEEILFYITVELLKNNNTFEPGALDNLCIEIQKRLSIKPNENFFEKILQLANLSNSAAWENSNAKKLSGEFSVTPSGIIIAYPEGIAKTDIPTQPAWPAWLWRGYNTRYEIFSNWKKFYTNNFYFNKLEDLAREAKFNNVEGYKNYIKNAGDIEIAIKGLENTIEFLEEKRKSLNSLLHGKSIGVINTLIAAHEAKIKTLKDSLVSVIKKISHKSTTMEVKIEIFSDESLNNSISKIIKLLREYKNKDLSEALEDAFLSYDEDHLGDLIKYLDEKSHELAINKISEILDLPEPEGEDKIVDKAIEEVFTRIQAFTYKKLYGENEQTQHKPLDIDFIKTMQEKLSEDKFNQCFEKNLYAINFLLEPSNINTISKKNLNNAIEILEKKSIVALLSTSLICILQLRILNEEDSKKVKKLLNTRQLTASDPIEKEFIQMLIDLTNGKIFSIEKIQTISEKLRSNNTASIEIKQELKELKDLAIHQKLKQPLPILSPALETSIKSTENNIKNLSSQATVLSVVSGKNMDDTKHTISSGTSNESVKNNTPPAEKRTLLGETIESIKEILNKDILEKYDQEYLTTCIEILNPITQDVDESVYQDLIDMMDNKKNKFLPDIFDKNINLLKGYQNNLKKTLFKELKGI